MDKKERELSSIKDIKDAERIEKQVKAMLNWQKGQGKKVDVVNLTANQYEIMKRAWWNKSMLDNPHDVIVKRLGIEVNVI